MSLNIDGITLTIVSGTTIEVKSSSSYIEETVKDGVITDIRFRDNKISLGDSFNFDMCGVKSLYSIKEIRKISDKLYILNTHFRNKATYYIMPILEYLEVPKRVRKKNDLTIATVHELNKYCLNTYLINCYIGIHGGSIINGHLYLKFRYSNHETYQILENLISEHSLFVKTIEHNNFTLFKFIVPKQFRKDLVLFLEGKYSQLSGELKSLIIKFHTLRKNSVMYQILHKEGVLKRQMEALFQTDLSGLELESIPEMKNETIEI